MNTNYNEATDQQEIDEREEKQIMQSLIEEGFTEV